MLQEPSPSGDNSSKIEHEYSKLLDAWKQELSNHHQQSSKNNGQKSEHSQLMDIKLLLNNYLDQIWTDSQNMLTCAQVWKTGQSSSVSPETAIFTMNVLGLHLMRQSLRVRQNMLNILGDMDHVQQTMTRDRSSSTTPTTVSTASIDTEEDNIVVNFSIKEDIPTLSKASDSYCINNSEQYQKIQSPSLAEYKYASGIRNLNNSHTLKKSSEHSDVKVEGKIETAEAVEAPVFSSVTTNEVLEIKTDAHNLHDLSYKSCKESLFTPHKNLSLDGSCVLSCNTGKSKEDEHKGIINKNKNSKEGLYDINAETGFYCNNIIQYEQGTLEEHQHLLLKRQKKTTGHSSDFSEHDLHYLSDESSIEEEQDSSKIELSQHASQYYNLSSIISMDSLFSYTAITSSGDEDSITEEQFHSQRYSPVTTALPSLLPLSKSAYHLNSSISISTGVDFKNSQQKSDLKKSEISNSHSGIYKGKTLLRLLKKEQTYKKTTTDNIEKVERSSSFVSLKNMKRKKFSKIFSQTNKKVDTIFTQ